MSLINEALKEAQRSRAERTAPRAAAPVSDAFFPYPEGKRKAQRSGLVFIVGAVIVIMVAAGAAIVVRARMTRAKAPLASVPRSLPPVASAPAPVAPVPVVQAPVGAAGPPARPHEPSRVAAASGAPATRASVPSAIKPPAPVVDSTPVRTAAPPPVAPPPKPVSTPGIRVVLGASGFNPVADSLFRLAYAEHSKGNLERAQELYEKTIAQPQAPADAYNNYGALMATRNNPLGAAQMFQQAISRDPRNVNAWVNLGDSHKAIGHNAEAMSAFARAAQLDGSNVAVKTRLAAMYFAIGDTASARRSYEDAVRSAPQDPNAHYEFGKFLQAQHDVRGAIAEYQLFVDNAPGKVPAATIDGVRQYITSLRRTAP